MFTMVLLGAFFTLLSGVPVYAAPDVQKVLLGDSCHLISVVPFQSAGASSTIAVDDISFASGRSDKLQLRATLGKGNTLKMLVVVVQSASNWIPSGQIALELASGKSVTLFGNSVAKKTSSTMRESEITVLAGMCDLVLLLAAGGLSGAVLRVYRNNGQSETVEIPDSYLALLTSPST